MKPEYSVKKELRARDKEFPLNSKKYPAAHRAANKAEKAKYPEGFKKLTRLEHKLGKDELLGHSYKSGKIEVSAKVPKKNREEVALHEKVENKILCKKCGKKNCKCKK